MRPRTPHSPNGREAPPAERAHALRTLADVVDEHADELAALDVMDNGSPIKEMRKDVPIATAQLRYFAGLVLQLRGETIPTGPGRLNYTLRQPYGVVARIIPFNHPLMFAAGKMAAPLAAGNTIIVKPSEHTSLSALRFAELANEVLPPGVVNMVTGYGPDRRRCTRDTSGDSSSCLHRSRQDRPLDPGASSERQPSSTSVSELGGKNPIVVFNDADLDAAVDGAIRGMNFTWQGQSCGSTSRVIVQRELYDNFVDLLARTVSDAQARRTG